MSAIRFEQVSKHYPNTPRPAVEACSLNVESGQFVVLLGGSGSGKTTLLKMVNRLIEPTTGAIYLGDQNVLDLDPVQLRRRIGYVIQQIGLFPHLTVAQNISVAPELLGWPKIKITARVDKLLTLIGLSPSEYRERYPAQLSGGQQQRVGLARALAADPPVLLMDEPFGALDALTRANLQAELLRLHAQLPKTVLFVTHDVDEALKLADKIAVIEHGQIVQYDTPLNLLRQPATNFVRDLLGADDVTRQLSLLPVTTVMTALNGSLANLPTIESTADTRVALTLLLRSAAETVIVQHNGQPLGQIRWSDIRRSLADARLSDAHLP